MTLFEAGILSKMTTDEYRNLPQQSRRSEPVTESENQDSTDVTGDPSASTSQVFVAHTRKTIPVGLTRSGATCEGRNIESLARSTSHPIVLANASLSLPAYRAFF